MYTPEVWVEQHVYLWKMMVGRPFVGFDHFSGAKPPLPPSALFEDSDDSEGPPKTKYCMHLLMYCAFYIPTRPICRNPHISWKESSHQPRKMHVYQPSTTAFISSLMLPKGSGSAVILGGDIASHHHRQGSRGPDSGWCFRKLGSMVSKWVISPTYLYMAHWG